MNQPTAARRPTLDLEGVLVVDKPAGMSSHDVVSKVRWLIGAGRRRGPKVGHCGTLDPDATGVLVICIGRSTRLVPYLQASTKTYDARMRLGVTTSTLDAQGEVVEERDATGIDEERLCEALKAFVGEIEQTPPMVSAVKVGGERLHRKARRGEVVDRPSRRITIHDIVLEDFDPGPPVEAAFLVTCTAGTYVRTLAADVGERLGVGGHLVALRRLGSGRFSTEEARSLDDIEQLVEEGRISEALLAPAEAMADYPAITVDEGDARAISHGRPLSATDKEGPVAVLAPDGSLLAVVEDADGVAKPRVVLVAGGS